MKNDKLANAQKILNEKLALIKATRAAKRKEFKLLLDRAYADYRKLVSDQKADIAAARKAFNDVKATVKAEVAKAKAGAKGERDAAKAEKAKAEKKASAQPAPKVETVKAEKKVAPKGEKMAAPKVKIVK